MKGSRQYRRCYFILIVIAVAFTAGCSGEKPPAAHAPPPEESRTYEVDGEATVAGVANEFGVEVADILEQNPGLDPSDRDRAWLR